MIFIIFSDGEAPPANPNSGIYQLVPQKTNDTLYKDLSIDEDTVDVKIPDPFWKTGLIGG